MLHPIISLLIHRPELVVDHVAAYADLVQQEAADAGAEVLQRSAAWGLAAIALTVGLALGGVALMLGVLQAQFHWILVAVPLGMLGLALLAWRWAARPLSANRFKEVRSQWQQDLQTLRRAGVTRHGL